MAKRALYCGLATLAVAALLPAQAIDLLREIESRLLDRRLAAYEEAHDREQEANRQLSQATDRLHQALGNREIEVDELRRMEAQLSLAREAALLRARETAELRQEIYNRMERLAELDRELETTRGSLTGTWTLNLGERGSGTLALRSTATEVDGVYTLSEGRSGSVSGTVSSGTVKLRTIDSQQGLDLELSGRLSEDGNEIQGMWQAFELADGKKASGGWIAKRRTQASP